jgi:inner membrane protein
MRSTQVTAAVLVAIVLLADALLHLLDPPYPALGLLDEPAHLATAGLLVLAIAPERRAFVVSALVAAVALDLDHVPEEFGADLLTRSTTRPVTHSLAGLALAGGLVALSRRPAIVAGVACGIGSHLLRDLATGGGIPLLWPLTDKEFQLPYAVYLAAVLALAVRLARSATLRKMKVAL